MKPYLCPHCQTYQYTYQEVITREITTTSTYSVEHQTYPRLKTATEDEITDRETICPECKHELPKELIDSLYQK
jgi:uncharacterized protein with PIN domain